MAVSTAAGTTVGIVAGPPTTFDALGYGALTFVLIGEITDAGSHGKTFAEVTHNPIGTRGTQKFKGSFNLGTKSIQLALDDDDAGQTLAKAALESDEDYYFQVTYPDGSSDNFPAKVMAFTKSVSSVDTVITGALELSLTTDKAGVGIIEIPAV